MCWPRNFCCRCPKQWPLRSPFLTFGRTPRRSPFPQPSPASWWTPPAHNIQPFPVIPPPDTRPVIPPLDPRPVIPRRRRVQFIGHDDDDWPPVITAAPFIPPPFIPPPVAVPQFPMVLQQSLNPQLVNPRGCYPFLDWDLTHFSSTARVRQVPTISTPGGQEPAFAEPATWPHTNLVTITFADEPMLQTCESRWGPIVARGQGVHPVRLEDVLDAIYRYFAQPLTPPERASMTWHTWTAVSDAYRRRLALPGSPNLRAYDMEHGLLRSDVLQGVTKFCGLVPIAHGYFRLMLSS
ncbi:hypothetical protein C8R45DRAFT_867654 [Mycena sanguinolenta]|nr:hypothetical protein C8R45DRAFT_867654 [Mycena sanguinolenta]